MNITRGQKSIYQLHPFSHLYVGQKQRNELYFSHQEQQRNEAKRRQQEEQMRRQQQLQQQKQQEEAAKRKEEARRQEELRRQKQQQEEERKKQEEERKRCGILYYSVHTNTVNNFIKTHGLGMNEAIDLTHDGRDLLGGVQ